MNMRIRPYIDTKDFDEIRTWITDERVHAMWCADLICFPMEKDDFTKVMRETADIFGDSPYVATSNDGRLIGFFCYSVNLETDEGMLKFVMINPEYRGKGYGQEMLKLAVKYAFDITNVHAVQLNVFPENAQAKHCYENVGFAERKTELNAFKYKDESWGRCNMVITKMNEEKDSVPDRKQIERIERYERIMSKAEQLLNDSSYDDPQELRDRIDELKAYYESDEWKRDYADDEAGKLPKDMKRGVLSEDGIYDLLERYLEIEGGKDDRP